MAENRIGDLCFSYAAQCTEFADKGLDIVPFPCDYQLSGKMQLSIFSFMPQGFALELSAMALKEYLGLLALKIL